MGRRGGLTSNLPIAARKTMVGWEPAHQESSAVFVLDLDDPLEKLFRVRAAIDWILLQAPENRLFQLGIHLRPILAQARGGLRGVVHRRLAVVAANPGELRGTHFVGRDAKAEDI